MIVTFLKTIYKLYYCEGIKTGNQTLVNNRSLSLHNGITAFLSFSNSNEVELIQDFRRLHGNIHRTITKIKLLSVLLQAI